MYVPADSPTINAYNPAGRPKEIGVCLFVQVAATLDRGSGTCQRHSLQLQLPAGGALCQQERDCTGTRVRWQRHCGAVPGARYAHEDTPDHSAAYMAL